MFAFLLIIFLIWLFFKLGIGITKILASLLIIAIIFIFFIHFLLPAITLMIIAALAWAIFRN